MLAASGRTKITTAPKCDKKTKNNRKFIQRSNHIGNFPFIFYTILLSKSNKKPIFENRKKGNYSTHVLKDVY